MGNLHQHCPSIHQPLGKWLTQRILDPFLKSQHRPSLIKTSATIKSEPICPLKRWNFQKANWMRCSSLWPWFSLQCMHTMSTLQQLQDMIPTLRTLSFPISSTWSAESAWKCRYHLSISPTRAGKHGKPSTLSLAAQRKHHLVPSVKYHCQCPNRKWAPS